MVSSDGGCVVTKIASALAVVVSVLLVAGAVGCGAGVSETTTESSSTTTSSTTTTEPPAVWKQVNQEGELPSARCYHALVYDSTARKLLMFAGFDGSSTLSETWSYDASENTWRNLAPEGEGQPASTRQMCGAYDPTSRKVVSYDGTSWGFDVAGNTWGALGPGGDKLRPARLGASMVKDEKSGTVILFGGTDMSKAYDETWSYDPRGNSWTNMKPAGELPPGRSDAGMAYDPVSGRVILFGGVDSDFNCFDDTWSYDPEANTWSKYATASGPSARSGLGLAYDPHSRQIVLFGGIDSQLVCYNDTWTFDSGAGTWTEVALAGDRPLARGRVMLAYSADIDRLVLFGGAAVQADDAGGFGYLVYLNDLWVYGVQSSDDLLSEVTVAATTSTSSTLPIVGGETTTTLP